MSAALQEARAAMAHDDVPIGAVVVHDDGRVIGRGRNERELREDPTAHAEVLALREAAAALGTWRVLDEHALRDAGALHDVRGRDRPLAGPARGLRDGRPEGRRGRQRPGRPRRARLNHRPEVVGGVLADEAAELLRSFFRARR